MSDRGQAPKLVCRKCRLRVNTIEYDDGTVHYYHAGALDLSSAGKSRVKHDPDPVPMTSDDDFTPLCDFCNARYPAWVIPLTRKLESRIVTERSDIDIHDDGLWAACDICEKMVEGGEAQALLERSVRSMKTVTGEPIGPALKETLRLRQAEFWRAEPGPARSIRKAPEPAPASWHVHPRDMPKLRSDVTAFYRRYEDQAIATWLADADLYLVRAKQVQYAAAMAAPLDSHEGLLGYVPARDGKQSLRGFMCLEDAGSSRAPTVTLDGHEFPVRAFAWWVREGEEAVSTIAWTSAADVPPQGLPPEHTKLVPLLLGTYSRYGADARAHLFYKRRAVLCAPSFFYPLFAIWYRMTEPRYASTSVDKAPPKDRRKAARCGSSGSLDVTVVDVRHPRHSTGRHGGGREAGWTMDYRETVSEHSKLVRYGEGRKYVRRVWIDPYERGPENAPRKADKPVVRVVK